jgi:hypothetical protein
MVGDKRRDGLLICLRLYPQDSETGPKLPYMEASLSYTDDQGWSLFKYPRDVMLHIILISETLLTNQRPCCYTATVVYTATVIYTTTTASIVATSQMSTSGQPVGHELTI